ncbi:MAG: outer membrane lipoprotein carrier protein LolA [Bacteroidales bacterium]|nr:outer membrane lipoprotein carrier protein LolA [Bacteroidales bacterium]
MKIIQHVFVALIFLTVQSAWSQENSQRILNELTQKTNSYTNIKVGFSYEMTNKEADIHEVTEGELLVAGDKYRLKIAGQEIISNGKTMWTYIADADEVQINEINQEDSFSPTKLLSSYTEDYDTELEKEYTENNRTYYLFKLHPKDKESGFDYVHLKVDKAKMQVAAFVLYDFDKNVFSYLIKEYLTNVALSENAFTFDPSKYPGVDIIDMR